MIDSAAGPTAASVDPARPPARETTASPQASPSHSAVPAPSAHARINHHRRSGFVPLPRARTNRTRWSGRALRSPSARADQPPQPHPTAGRPPSARPDHNPYCRRRGHLPPSAHADHPPAWRQTGTRPVPLPRTRGSPHPRLRIATTRRPLPRARITRGARRLRPRRTVPFRAHADQPVAQSPPAYSRATPPPARATPRTPASLRARINHVRDLPPPRARTTPHAPHHRLRSRCDPHGRRPIRKPQHAARASTPAQTPEPPPCPRSCSPTARTRPKRTCAPADEADPPPRSRDPRPTNPTRATPTSSPTGIARPRTGARNTTSSSAHRSPA